MSKSTKPKSASKRSQIRAKVSSSRAPEGKSNTEIRQVHFGMVTIEAPLVSKSSMKISVDAGRAALRRARDALIKPGIRLRVAPEVPLYRADPATPGLLIQTLNGRQTRGRWIDGRFKEIR